MAVESRDCQRRVVAGERGSWSLEMAVPVGHKERESEKQAARQRRVEEGIVAGEDRLLAGEATGLLVVEEDCCSLFVEGMEKRMEGEHMVVVEGMDAAVEGPHNAGGVRLADFHNNFYLTW